MNLSPETRALLTLHLVPGIGPKLLDALLERFGSASAALAASADELTDVPHLGPKIARQFRQSLESRDVDEELKLLAEHGVNVIVRGSPEYPPPLAAITGSPPLLFVRGTIDPAESRCIGLVGSRTCTSLGKRWAERMARDFTQAGWTVVSGLARGIDAHAHHAALEAGGRTLAVLAGGLKKIYPPEHSELANEVAANGALITESSMRMEPMAGLFPARNRIISALSRAIVVIEADEKSGALITARHALEQGREVFVIPGPVDGPTWSGNHLLLRQGARFVRNARDVLEDLEALPPLFEKDTAPSVPQRPNLTGPALAIWEFLSESRTIDEIADHLAQPVGSLTGLLMQLELQGIVKRLPGNVYERA